MIYAVDRISGCLRSGHDRNAAVTVSASSIRHRIILGRHDSYRGEAVVGGDVCRKAESLDSEFEQGGRHGLLASDWTKGYPGCLETVSLSIAGHGISLISGCRR